MPGGSIYVQKDEKFTGSSPQWYYEKYWLEDAKARQKSRAIKAAVGFVLGAALAIRLGIPLLGGFATALLVAGVTAAIDWLHEWRLFQATSVWRGRRRGEVITKRLLRRGLARKGYRVLDGRAIRGQASIDHLIIGPAGVWIVDNESWSPDTYIDAYNGKLFFGEKFGSHIAKPLVEQASAFADLLGRETGITLAIQPMLAVHCGLLPRSGVVTAEGITLLKPKMVTKLIRGSQGEALDEEQIELLARTAARELMRDPR